MKKIVLITALIVSFSSSAMANELFKTCIACHGQKAQKHAMGKSKIINLLSAKEIKDALLGYKNGNYGGAMKAVMRGQALRLKPQDIEALSHYIPTLR